MKYVMAAGSAQVEIMARCHDIHARLVQVNDLIRDLNDWAARLTLLADEYGTTHDAA